METQFDKLKTIIDRPRMYVGNTPHIFTAIWNWIWAYDLAKLESGAEGIVPSGFLPWVETLPEYKHPTKRLDELLVERSNCDEDLAFAQFRELLLIYISDAK